MIQPHSERKLAASEISSRPSRSKARFAVFLLATTFLTSFANALECPVLKLPDPVSAKVQKCLTELETLIKPKVDVYEVRQILLFRYNVPNADQPFVIDAIYTQYCEMLQEVPGVPSVEAETALKVARARLHEREPSREIIHTRDLTGMPMPYGLPIARASHAAMPSYQTNVSGFGFAFAQAPVGDTAPRHLDFIQENPFVVNDTNKWFVIVASPTSEQAGIRILEQLALAVPKYEFALYAPYQGSRYFAVMMATWVSKDVADAAVKVVKGEVVPALRSANLNDLANTVAGAYPWKCPQEGEIGTC